jgi:N-acetylmuramoyl-L-alanine amidase
MLAGNKPNKDIANRLSREMANESGGDLYIAIHCNAAPDIRHSEVTGYKNSDQLREKGKKKKKVTKKVPQYAIGTHRILLQGRKPTSGPLIRMTRK